MKLRVLISLFCSVLTLAAVSGCATHPPTPAQVQINEQRQLARDLAANKLRALPEEQRPQPATNVFWDAFVTVTWRLPKQGVDRMYGHTPSEAVRMMEDSTSADHRRTGIFRIDDNVWGRKPPYTKRYAQIGQNDADFTVRAAAIRALNRSRAEEARALYLHALGDDNALVRLEAAKAIANMPDEAAIPALIAHLQQADENRDVRIAAADALRSYPAADTARALIDMLNDRDFSIAWQAHQSLRIMTGVELHYDVTAWLKYVSTHKAFS